MVTSTTQRRQGVVGSMGIKAPCRLATTANVSLNGLAAIDGVTPEEGDRILVKTQTDGVENGVYAASSSDWTRDLDCNGVRDLVKGTVVGVTDGSANGGTYWKVSTSNPITVGTTSLSWEQTMLDSGIPPVPGPTTQLPYVLATKYMSAAQLAGVQGTGPMLDVIDELDRAIADCGDVDWQGSIAAQLPSAGGVKAGGTVIVPPGVYSISRVMYLPAHVRLMGQGGGGFFNPRANDASSSAGNVGNVKQSVILANFPAGTGAGQAGRMWVIESSTWTAAGARIGYRTCYTGTQVAGGAVVTFTPGIAIEGICIDSVRNPATGLHITTQIPYGAIKMVGATNARIHNVSYAGVDWGILINAMWGYSLRDVFGYSFLGGVWQVLDVNAAELSGVYVNRDTSLDATAERTVSNSTRPDAVTDGQFSASDFPEDITNYRMGTLAMFSNGLSCSSVTCESWDIAFVVYSAANAGITLRNLYSEGSIIAPLATYAMLGSIDGFFDFSAGSRYGYCIGRVNSMTITGALPRRLHCKSPTEDPNRNIRINVGNPDLYVNLGGGRSANMITYSSDPTQGATLANMTVSAASATLADQAYNGHTLTASAAAVSSITKTGANIAAPNVGTINGVDYGDHDYCHWADLKAGTSTTAAINLEFSGGASAITYKVVITWTAGVPSLVLSGTGATGFCEAIGDSWYRINVAGPCNANTTMVARIYLGDGVGNAVLNSTMYLGEHQVSPTSFPLQPVYNMTATVPRPGPTPDGTLGGEHWEWRDGITYTGDQQHVIRVSASGYPWALGYDTTNVNTGTFTTLDSALRRIAQDSTKPWEIKAVDGETVNMTANNPSLVHSNPRYLFSKTGAGADPTVNCTLTPFGTMSSMPVEGNFNIQFVDVALTMQSTGVTDYQQRGFIHLRGGRGNTGNFHIGAATIDLKSKGALFQQGTNTINYVTLGIGKDATITGSADACLHSVETSSLNSETKYAQTSAGTLGGVIVGTSGSSNGWYGNCTMLWTTVT